MADSKIFLLNGRPIPNRRMSLVQWKVRLGRIEKMKQMCEDLFLH